MLAAGVSNQYRLPLDAMPWPAVCRTSVNRVLVVEAAAGRVKLDQLVAHLEFLCAGCAVSDLVRLLPVAANRRQQRLSTVWRAGCDAELRVLLRL